MSFKKKLIEVALPLAAINKASAREKSIRHGHPSTLHLWWARRPLAAARAVIFAQMVDDPSAHPDLFRTKEAQEKERQRLFQIIEELVQWESTNDEKVLQRARDEIWQSWRRTCAENADHPRAKELFDRHELPAFHDPFAGGGSLPLEAQRLGLEAHASDLNPVAVLINKAMIEIPPKFAGQPPVNPDYQSKPPEEKALHTWKGAQGLAEDVRYYGRWMRDEAEKRIGHLYPKIKVSEEMVRDPDNPRPDLEPYVGKELTVIAWIWARTVKSPNPAFAHVDVPLASTFMLSTRKGKEAWIEPVIDDGGYQFRVWTGAPMNSQAVNGGTKLGRGAEFRCLMSEAPIDGDYIKNEGAAGRLGSRMMAMVAEGERERIYLAPTKRMESVSQQASPTWRPEGAVPARLTGGTCVAYGLARWSDLFTQRQLVALTEISDLLQSARARVQADSVSAGLNNLNAGRCGSADAYAAAMAVYLTFCLDKATITNTTQATWQKNPDRLTQAFGRQAVPMVWDHAEANPLSNAGGGFGLTPHAVAKVLERLPAAPPRGRAFQEDAVTPSVATSRIVSTDPPYYDNISYGDLSDYFYVWMRRALRSLFPDLLSTVAVPKQNELVAAAYRHGGKEKAEAFFLTGMGDAIKRLANQAHPAYPVTIFYAFKQSERRGGNSQRTGWETFLEAVIRAGFTLSGTWPIRTELIGNLKKNVSALASSIVLVCRPRPSDAPTATRREFVVALRSELPAALAHLQRGNIAPVDLAQAAIGPGMAVYTRYSRVVDAAGEPVTVRDALALINQILDEELAEQEGDFDADTRWALAWFEQSGFDTGEYGVAETLSKAKNISVEGLEEAGILTSKAGKVQLLRPAQLPAGWDPATDLRLTVWETVHHLIRALEEGGESAAAELVAKLGSRAEVARELAYRLYTLCERKKRAAEALSYNALVQSWPEIQRLASEQPESPEPAPPTLFDQERA